MKKFIFISFLFPLFFSCTLNREVPDSSSSFFIIIHQPVDPILFDRYLSVKGSIFSHSQPIQVKLILSNQDESGLFFPEWIQTAENMFYFQCEISNFHAGLYQLSAFASNQSGETAFSTPLFVNQYFSFLLLKVSNISTNITVNTVTNQKDILIVSNTQELIAVHTLSNSFTNQVLLSSVPIASNFFTNLINSVSNLTAKVLPQWSQSGNIYTLNGNGFIFTVDALASGKVSEYSHSGNHAIVSGTNEHEGSTFWSSPQTWGWPPPYEMDGKAYNAQLISNDTVLILKSDPIFETGLIQIKRFQGSPNTNCMIITYGFSNFTSSNIQSAPWEVTRVGKDSLIYFPKESEYSNHSEFSPALENANECWYSDNASWKKSFRDGAERWIAVYRNAYVFIKITEKNTSTNEFAPNESEIEIYAGDNYFEVEEQGKYTLIAPHGNLEWKVIWTFIPTPSGLDTSIGSSELMQWTRTQISNFYSY